MSALHLPLRSPRLPLRFGLVLVLAGALLGGCGDDAKTPAVDAAADVTADDTTPSDVLTADSALPSDTASADVPAHCPVDGPAPSWATVDGGTFTARCGAVDVRVTPYADGVLRVELLPTPAAGPSRSWALAGAPTPAAQVWSGSAGAAFAVCTPELALTVAPDSCRIAAFDAAGARLVESASDVQRSSDGALSASYATPAGERFYGFGERNGAFDRRGTSMVFWNTDAYDSAYGGYGPTTDPLYLGIPFFVGLRDGRAYGVLTDDAHRLTLDMARAASDRWTLTTPRDRIDHYLVAGPDVAEVLRRYTALSGRTPLPPRWSLGFHQCRWGYTPDTAFAAVGAELRDRALPADGLWLDIQHLDGYRTFTWDPAAFPDPAGLLAGLAADGFKTVVIADPGLKAEPGWDVYDAAMAGGLALALPTGAAFVGTVWPGPSIFLDFTLPAARALWASRIGALADLGVRGIWLDVNEPTTFPESGGGQSIPDEVVAAGDGVPTTMAEVHNVYALHEARATFEGLAAARPDRRPFILSRAGYAGIQRYAAIWTGDAPSTWTSLAQTLPMMLNLGLSGVPFVGSDVGGYSGHATPELYARWMALGAVSPFFRAHVTSGVPGQEPWAFGQEVLDLSREHIVRRYALLPYLYSVFAEAAATGAPVLRPLVWHFQTDAVSQTTGDEALLGPSLLVAPVTAEGATERQVYLPPGRWYERVSGAAYDGPTTITQDLRLAALPLFVRGGAILPLQSPAVTADATAAGPLTLEVYPDTASSAFTLYDDAGDGAGPAARTRYTTLRDSAGATLAADAREGAFAPPARTLVVRMRRVDAAPSAVTLDGAPLSAQADEAALLASGTGYWWDPADLALVVAFADRAPFLLDARFTPAVALPGPPVAVPLEVQLPAGTPESAVVYVASDADGWQFHALTRRSETRAAGTLSVPRGHWFDYKYSWGDWCTVEKWPGCVEADNRYHFGAAHPVKQDEVFGWRAWCDDRCR